MSRKNTEKVCDELCELGYSATRYHAGLTAGERHVNQDDFLFDRKQIMVATNAFGMGIDKSNVNFVVHYNMPKDLESYYQEAGRAGRDGTESHCLLIYNAQDVRTNEWLIDHPNGEDTEEIDPVKHEQDMQRLRQMTFYSTTNNCLRAFILKYFGENPDQFCGNCSNCQTQFDSVDVTVEAQKIISCVKRMGERFGIAFVIDVLRGSKNQKIYQWGFQDLSTYGIMEDTSTATARNIADFLIQEGFLVKTDEQYRIIKLGERAKELLTKDAKLEMKLARDKPQYDKAESKAHKRKKTFDTLPENREALFEIIRLERARIASGLGVPAFQIFSDKTLVDMANKCPTTNEQFLEVNGVGEFKLQKFGEDFMGVIRAYMSVQ
ncbi:MAG: RQC domain-containing protein [Clostridia bacterium]